MLKNKFLLLPFLAVILVSFIFILSQIPTASVSPKNLPIGIVNEDSGEMSSNIYDSLIQQAPDAIQFVKYDTVDQMIEGMNERANYGGVVIPQEFSTQLQSLQGDQPQLANIQLYINEGLNAQIAPTIETMLTSITQRMSHHVSAELTKKLELAGVEMNKAVMQHLQAIGAVQPEQIAMHLSPVQPEQIQQLSNPISTEVIKINETGNLASVPGALFITVWISSLLGAMLFYIAGNKQPTSNNRSTYIFQVVQSLLPIVYAFFAGYTITLFSTWILGYEFDSFHAIALTLTIALIGFVYLILATLKWLKTPAIAIFGLLMFFGLPLIQMAPEMIPTFYQQYVLPWLPMRFLIDGLKDVLFFNKDILNQYSNTLLAMAGGSFILIWLNNFIMKRPVKE